VAYKWSHSNAESQPGTSYAGQSTIADVSFSPKVKAAGGHSKLKKLTVGYGFL